MSLDTVHFFFQAEDGIRDGRVTGVQTCALPISCPRATGTSRLKEQSCESVCGASCECSGSRLFGRTRKFPSASVLLRSEERRVGKEWSSRWWMHDYKDKELIEVDIGVFMIKQDR